MRVSTSYRFEFFGDMVSQTESKYVDAQQRISTGKQLDTPSDNPSGATLSVKARDLRTSLAQYSTNISSAKNFLSQTDTQLSAVNDILSQVQALAVQGANATNSADQLKGMATSIQQIQNRLVTLSNAQAADGRYLFAGQSTKTKPFDAANGTMTYSGDGASIVAETAPGSTMAINTQGSPLLTDIYNALESLKGNLNSGNTAGISNQSIKDISSLQTRLNAERGSVGAKIQSITALASQHQRRSDELTKSISDVEDIDMSKAITDYQQASTAYQAALQVAGQGYKLSLMDYIQ